MMEQYAIQQLSVFIENKKGELTDVTSILFEENLAIKSLLLLDSTDFGILRLIVETPRKAKDVLASAGYTVKINHVFAVKVENELGKFHRVAKILSGEDINILYTYAYRDENAGVFIFKVEQKDFQKAIESLQKANLEIMTSGFFY